MKWCVKIKYSEKHSISVCHTKCICSLEKLCKNRSFGFSISYVLIPHCENSAFNKFFSRFHSSTLCSLLCIICMRKKLMFCLIVKYVRDIMKETSLTCSSNDLVDVFKVLNYANENYV